MSRHPEHELIPEAQEHYLHHQQESLDLDGKVAHIFMGPASPERGVLQVYPSADMRPGSEFLVSYVTADGHLNGAIFLGGEGDKTLELGRARQNNPVLMELDEFVSDSHLTFEVEDGKLSVTDHSTNGT